MWVTGVFLCSQNRPFLTGRSLVSPKFWDLLHGLTYSGQISHNKSVGGLCFQGSDTPHHQGWSQCPKIQGPNTDAYTV